MIKDCNKKNILIVSNMYPSEEFPFFGTFVKNCESVLVENDFVVDKVVIDEKSSNLFNKFKIYIVFYFCVLRKLFLGNYDYVYGHYVSHVSIPLLIYRLFNSKIDIVIHVHGGDIKKLDGTSSVFFKVKRFLSASIL
ncbi:glycosyltransferase family 1 protein, partial [Vibrio sp. 10N.222.55.C6]